MKWLTRQELFVLCAVICLLLVGLVSKYYRASNPAPASSPAAKP